jgi:hypothetical protein
MRCENSFKMNTLRTFGLLPLLCLSLSCFGQNISPKEQASVTVQGKTIRVDYNAPSVHGRKIFGDGGRISQDPNYPVWRAGANSATVFHTDADLDIRGLHVPKGDYTLYVLLQDPSQWQLIINKQTGQWGLTYDQASDLGRVKMDMKKPSSPIEQLRYSFTDKNGNKVRLELGWENYLASVPITVQ